MDPYLKQNLIKGQEEFLKEQSLSTLQGLPGGGSGLLKFDTILRSVCLMVCPGGTGTGFLAKHPDLGTVFMSAGHNFQNEKGQLPDERIDFSKYRLHFGYTSGSPGADREGTILSCKLSDFGELTGSIGLGGKRRFFPGYIEEDSPRTREDYCMLLLPNSAAVGKRSRFNWLSKHFGKHKVDMAKLRSLPCGGKENYLKREPKDSLLSIFGHPGVDDDSHPQLRVSWGTEKYEGGIDPDHHIFYDVDTLGGNSGSPVIGRGSKDGQYEVKAIHIHGIPNPNPQNILNNSGQGLMHMKEWIKPQQQAESS